MDAPPSHQRWPFTYYIMQRGRGCFDFCDKGWVGCLWGVMPHIFNSSIVSTFGLEISNLALFKKEFASTSRNILATLR